MVCSVCSDKNKLQGQKCTIVIENSTGKINKMDNPIVMYHYVWDNPSDLLKTFTYVYTCIYKRRTRSMRHILCRL